jgi:O-methyltransferase involved in polyketide biosynthesis
VKKPSTNTALGPMVIVAVDQNENPPLIQDELAYKILPGRGKVIVIAAKWRPLGRRIAVVPGIQLDAAVVRVDDRLDGMRT